VIQQRKTTMTAEEWLACTDPEPMVEFLRARASDRKLRLFAVACCMRTSQFFKNEQTKNALDIVERFADGLTSQEELRQAAEKADQIQRETANAAYKFGEREGNYLAAEPLYSESYAADAILSAAKLDIHAVTYMTKCAMMPAYSSIEQLDRDAMQAALDSVYFGEPRIQVNLVRDIFANPFRPVIFDPAWLTPKVKTLAQAIYDDRAFEGMPILADALAEAGCSNPDILNHCRGPGPHVRGCWVVDLVLGKE
jgi:hypothetical protein